MLLLDTHTVHGDGTGHGVGRMGGRAFRSVLLRANRSGEEIIQTHSGPAMAMGTRGPEGPGGSGHTWATW